MKTGKEINVKMEKEKTEECIFKHRTLRVEVHPADIPWLKVFSAVAYKEMSECDEETKRNIFLVLDGIETEMIRYYRPEKINIASFGNYLPHLHWHIMARFKNDSHFPEPMWGVRQREGRLTLPSSAEFYERVEHSLRLKLGDI